ncbi:MAG: putative anti-sigma-YlaC factor YlaD [Patiriisocius sp.]|jgi:predicted anti-sigma-YlaC factor YlaD
MLTCKDITTDAHALLDGELSLWHRVRVRFHLMICQYCRRFVRQLGLTVDTLGNLDALDEKKFEPTDSEIDSVVERLKQAQK